MNPLANRTWWISHAIMWLGVLLGAMQATFTDFAKANPGNTSAAVALVVVGLLAKAIVSHGESSKALLFAAMLLLPFGSGCATSAAKTDVHAFGQRLARLLDASQPAPGIDAAAWTADKAGLYRLWFDCDVALNGPAPATATAAP